MGGGLLFIPLVIFPLVGLKLGWVLPALHLRFHAVKCIINATWAKGVIYTPIDALPYCFEGEVGVRRRI